MQIFADDSNPGMKMIALEMIKGLNWVPLDAVINTALNDPEPILRMQAAQYLARHVNEDPRIKGVLSELAQRNNDLQNKDWNGSKE